VHVLASINLNAQKKRRYNTSATCLQFHPSYHQFYPRLSRFSRLPNIRFSRLILRFPLFGLFTSLSGGAPPTAMPISCGTDFEALAAGIGHLAWMGRLSSGKFCGDAYCIWNLMKLSLASSVTHTECRCSKARRIRSVCAAREWNLSLSYFELVSDSAMARSSLR
jgi:hypothetical protein